MSVLVKDMNMPDSCLECPLFNGYGCKATYQMFHPKTNVGVRVSSCPLVELPEKHGRLIDADALMDIFADRLVKVSERYGIDSAVAGAVSGAMKLLDVQPTVIEAEGEG